MLSTSWAAGSCRASTKGRAGMRWASATSIFNGNLQDVPLPVSERTPEAMVQHGRRLRPRLAQQLANNIRTLSTRFNGVRGDGINNFDLSFFKDFRINERCACSSGSRRTTR